MAEVSISDGRQVRKSSWAERPFCELSEVSHTGYDSIIIVLRQDIARVIKVS
jgi:hypothetical protein